MLFCYRFKFGSYQCHRATVANTDLLTDRTLADNITKNSGKGKNKSAKLEVRPFMVKNYLWVFVNSMITNPTFDSQVCCRRY